MTTPGATEATTPEQAREIAFERCGVIMGSSHCARLADDIIALVRHAEANALRRCHDIVDQKAQACAALADACVIGAAGPYSKPDRTILDKRWHTAQAAAFRETAHAIRSLLPKEEGN